MTTINKLTVNPVAKTNLVPTTQFTLRARPSLPGKGLHEAVIGEVLNYAGTEDGKEINRVHVPVTLASKDSSGNPYILEKIYNIGQNSRGLSALLTDYTAWSGIEVGKDDVFDFNCNEQMKGRAVVVEVGYRVSGADVVAVITGFHPANQTETATV